MTILFIMEKGEIKCVRVDFYNNGEFFPIGITFGDSQSLFINSIKEVDKKCSNNYLSVIFKCVTNVGLIKLKLENNFWNIIE